MAQRLSQPHVQMILNFAQQINIPTRNSNMTCLFGHN